MLFKKEVTKTIAYIETEDWFYIETKIYFLKLLLYKSVTFSSNKDDIDTHHRAPEDTSPTVGYKIHPNSKQDDKCA